MDDRRKNSENGVFSENQLWRAWKKVEANAGESAYAAGGDGVSVDVFRRKALFHIRDLSEQLTNGTYFPGPLRRVGIPKNNGETRRLSIPCVVDRVAQTAVAQFLTPVLDEEFEDLSFGYRPGRSHLDAVRTAGSLRRQGFNWVVDADINDFFDCVPHEPLIDCFHNTLSRMEANSRILADTEALGDFVSLTLEASLNDFRDVTESGSTGQGLMATGLPTGSPLSPLLSNLYLDSFDGDMQRHGMRMIRFADDFIVLTKTEAKAEKALAIVEATLDLKGLSLNQEKTRISNFDRGFQFLGHLFVRSFIYRQTYDKAPQSAWDSPQDPLDALVKAGRVDNGTHGTALADPSVIGEESSARATASDPRILYVISPDQSLKVSGHAFAVFGKYANAPTLLLPPRDVDRIEIGNQVAIDVAALDLAAGSGTELVRINGWGETLGHWQGTEGHLASGVGGGKRILAQAALVNDDEAKLALAIAFIDGRVRNQRALLRRMNRSRNLDTVTKACEHLNRSVRRLPHVKDLDALRGEEGQAAKIYWPAFSVCLPKGWWPGGSRERRRGADPANILLDFYSNLLARDVRAALLKNGLHLSFGTGHSGRSIDDALVYDLIEEFRAPVAEALVPFLVARKQIGLSGFLRDAEGRHRALSSTTRAAIQAYESWMARRIKDPVDGQKRSWRGQLNLQAMRLVKAIEQNAPYQAYVMDY